MSDRPVDGLSEPPRPVWRGNAAPIDSSGFITVARLAGLICRDAQDEDYDHGAQPTVAHFDDPLPSCPRHYAMASEMLAARTATPSSEEDAWPSDKDFHDSLAAHARSPEHHYTADDCRRALATTPARSDAGDGLDVERLQRAYEACDVEFMTSAETLSSFLRRVAAEYVRLSESTGSEDGAS